MITGRARFARYKRWDQRRVPDLRHQASLERNEIIRDSHVPVTLSQSCMRFIEAADRLINAPLTLGEEQPNAEIHCQFGGAD